MLENGSDRPIAQRFFVDLEIDGLFAERWEIAAMGPGATQSVKDWEGLSAFKNLSNGTHELGLRILPNGLFHDGAAPDQVVTVPFDWVSPTPSSTSEAPHKDKAPNLAAVTPADWGGPILVYSKDPASTQRLPSVNWPTYVRIAFGNAGLSSITGPFSVHLFLDGVLVTRYREEGLIAGAQVVKPEENQLDKLVRPRVGWHQLMVVMDREGAVEERSVGDNVFVQEFYWAEGVTPTLSPIAPLVQFTQAGLVPFAPPGWDGAIVATQRGGVFTSPLVLDTNQQTYVQWAIKNPGTVPYGTSYEVTLRLDGDVVGRWPRTSLAPNTIDVGLDFPLEFRGSSRFLGPHRLTLEIHNPPSLSGPGQLVGAVFREFVWSTDPRVQTPQVEYTSQALANRLAPLDQLLTSSQNVSEMAGAASQLVGITDAVYYLLYNRSLYQENLEIHLFDSAEFETWIAIECQDRASGLSVDVRGAYDTACGHLVEYGGYHTFWRGRQRIVIRADRPAAQVLAALAHELGHFRQSFLRPELDAGNGTLNFYALREAQAYAHEVFFFQALQNAVQTPLLRYPKTTAYEQFIEADFATLAQDASRSEHARGKLLYWLTALTEPSLRNQGTELLGTGRLSQESARGVLAYLLAFEPAEVERYVDTRMRDMSLYLPLMQNIAKGRLATGLPYWEEGSPFLREIGLISP